MKLAIELDLPDGAVNQTEEAALVRSVKEQAVLKLDSERRVSVGEAAGMLGSTRIEFLDLLRTSGVGFLVDLDPEDFDQFRKMRDSHRPIQQ
jgi:hypothetical protein